MSGRRRTDGIEEKGDQHRRQQIYIEDLREEFARDFVFPALRANAIYEGTISLERHWPGL